MARRLTRILQSDVAVHLVVDGRRLPETLADVSFGGDALLELRDPS